MLKKILTITLIAIFILPLLAEARAGAHFGGGGRSGGGFSSGGGGGFSSYRSSGGQFGNYNYRPRSTYSSPSSPSYASPRPYMNAPRSSGSSIFSGLASGLFGAWLYNKFFHSENAVQNKQQNQISQTSQTAPTTQPATQPATSKGGGGILHLILILAIFFIVWHFIKNRRKKNLDDSKSQYFSSEGSTTPTGKLDIDNSENFPREQSQQLIQNISQTDYGQFENVFTGIQNAWSQNDLPTLQRLTTPEMYNNFSSLAQENQQQNITNVIQQVKILSKKLQNAWQEGEYSYARVVVTWSAIDYAINNSLSPQDPGYLIDGSINEPSISTEIWIFQRRENGPWLLAEVQQL